MRISIRIPFLPLTRLPEPRNAGDEHGQETLQRGTAQNTVARHLVLTERISCLITLYLRHLHMGPSIKLTQKNVDLT